MLVSQIVDLYNLSVLHFNIDFSIEAAISFEAHSIIITFFSNFSTKYVCKAETYSEPLTIDAKTSILDVW